MPGSPPLLVTLTVLLPAPPSLGAGFGAGAGTIDITKVLAGFPEFSSFSSMLTETNVALAISSRDKVTVLALNNTAAAVAFLPRPPGRGGGEHGAPAVPGVDADRGGTPAARQRVQGLACSSVVTTEPSPLRSCCSAPSLGSSM